MGYDWEFVPEGANRTPPVNSEVGDKADKLETAISCYQENPKVYTSEAFSYDRLQAYTNLIEQLLACANDGELNNILQANQELIDPEFLQVMENCATWLEQQGNNNDAAWLRYIPQQLGQYLNPQAGSIEEYQGFLLELLEAEAESNDPAVVYTILQRGQHLLDDTFPQLLQQFARNVFSQENAQDVAFTAGVIQNLCNNIAQFPLGSRANNLEIAITGYQTLSEVYTREAFPEYWATTQNNLGSAYQIRIRGEREYNLELAIAAYHLSLEVYTREAFPEDWARSQNNLGNAYGDRILGERADNLELAIAAYKLSLEVTTREAFPVDWAMTQNNLGNAYSYRILGERADNLELAIAALNLSLEVYTREAFPERWAGIQNNLGNAYGNRILGERADNTELAIAAYNQSLEVLTCEAFPEQWARSQNNLGNAYRDRILGERADNLELAITAFNLSLEVYTREAFPEDWARSQNNLGNAYGNRILGERADNLELAIAAFNLSLEVRTREAFPEDWARSQNNLGNAYGNRILGERADNLELAIAAFNQSLEVYTREGFPEYWARSQNNLGAAYNNRIRGERAANLELAIAAFNQSLEVFTPTAFPTDCLRTGRNLGHTANFIIEDWETAIKGYNLAIEAVENTRLQALNPQRQQEILSDAMDVYHGIVQSYLNLNQKDRALEYVERSKTRYLVQLLTDRDIYPKGNIPPTIITELDRLRRAIIGEEQQLAIQEQTRNRGVILTPDQQKQPILNDYTHLNHLKQELNQLIDREITPIDPTFSLTQKVQTIPLTEIQSLIDQQTAILEWYIAGDSIMAFVVTSQRLKVWQSSTTDRDKLINFIKDYREAYENNKTEWIKNLNSCLNQLSKILHIDELLELIPQDCTRLIIIPHWFLHIIPLHCLPLQNGQFLYQSFSKGVGYVPSCQLLKLVKSSQRENFDRLFAIKNPTRKGLKPLLGANLEIERISQGFDAEKTIIIGESEASEQTLENRRQELQASHCIHFSCHGKFDNKSPRDSALMLADPEGNLGESANLTLAEVFEKLDLRECRLVTFSACESGIIESKADSISDEYVGLPSGFLFAGSSSVVSTLWTVDPLATTLFMTKFYHDLKRISIQDQGSIAIVLNNTQTWLRTLTSKKLGRIKNNSEFQKLLIEAFADNKRDRNKFKDLLEAAVKRQPYPFESPYYWTAFIATGV
ncbi:CHAT domain-containing protein [Dolichospermum flos-aquae CCAP 1403/13F]|uniref:CHAT domain-containing protein n=2 Tax=Dolichospermum flosaquae TaxID=1166 RepID=A0A6H2C707_DOLFA|nr:CHAT domain-containing protein [Dolichospermum flos-aquae CCAP 1403/13F]